MCSHRTDGRWGRIWTRFCQAFLIGFVGIETAAIVTGGITLSGFLRRLFGLDEAEQCEHTHAGRVFVLSFATWLAAHIGFGKFGIGAWLPRRTGGSPCSP
jgi:hypothetical protein